MKKWFLSGMALVLFLAACPAQERLSERTYLVTDRSWYAAGETLWCSAFCFDVADGVKLSSFSSVAYLELTSVEGVAVTGKIALQGGRGAGRLDLPRTLPTGNYRLLAYTASSRNEEGYDYLAGSRIISIYNTLSTARVKDGVEVGRAPVPVPAENRGPLDVTPMPDGRMRLSTTEPVTLSVSAFRNEGFPEYGTPSLPDALSKRTTAWTHSVLPEYDGEIITLRLTAPDGSPYRRSERPEIFLSRPGRPGDIYSSDIQPDGTVRFFTNNLYGDGDLVLSVGMDSEPFQVELVSPFVRAEGGPIPSLALDPLLKEKIGTLGVRMQVASAFEADTLYSALPLREVPFVGEDVVRYVLDDYTRFATMREVFVEYLSDIRSRRRDGKVTLHVRCRDQFAAPAYYSPQPSLILVDGVPVADHDLVYNLDPSLIREIDVYPYRYAPFYVYSGIGNFVSFKGDLAGLRFGSNVRMISYTGVSLPQAFVPSDDPRYPMVRETLLWQPLLELRPGEEILLPALTAEEGYILVVEGATLDGKPVYYRKSS